MSKEYYVNYANSDFFVHRPNGGILTRAANEDNAKYICAELNRLLHRIHAREEDEMKLFPPATLEDAIKNTGSTPKYDPCRKFLKGDIVEPVSCNGRAPLYLRKYIGTKQVVESDEDNNGIVGIVGDVEAVSAAFLKLVTPVNELEPYRIGIGIDSQLLYCNNELIAEFEKTEDAKRVCALLNAEHRKEQSNG